jgi:hypothetical protein
MGKRTRSLIGRRNLEPCDLEALNVLLEVGGVTCTWLARRVRRHPCNVLVTLNRLLLFRLVDKDTTHHQPVWRLKGIQAAVV